MRFEGSLTVWHVERGYGSVMPEQGGQQLFIHISAFPQEGPQPVVGERISFEIVSGRNNQKQASKVQRLKAATIKPSVRSAARRPAAHKSRPVLAYVLFGVAVAAGLLSWLLFNPADGQRLARAARLASSTTTTNDNVEFQSVCLPQGRAEALRSVPLRVRSTASKA
jgi:cold shock CspA family protein